jgi:peptidoglycan hydrolase CwlO-like protein
LSGQLEAIGLAKKAGDGEIDLQQKALENTLDREKKLWLKSFEADRIITQLTKENTDLKSKVDDVLAQWSETKDEVARFRALNLKQEEELNRLRVDLVTLKQSIEEDQSMTEQNTAIAAFRALQVEDNAATKQKDPPSVPQKPASPRVKRN